MRYRGSLLVGVGLVLTACGSKPAVDEKNASVEEVTQKVREASHDQGLISPGKWQSSVTIEEVSMPGLPQEAAEHMKKMLTRTHTTETCLTPEEVKQPKAGFFGGDDHCRYDHFTMKGGKIDAEMRCERDGMTQAMQMSGTYSPNAYTMHMTSTQRGGPSEEGNVSMKMKVDAKRIGACTGKEA